MGGKGTLEQRREWARRWRKKHPDVVRAKRKRTYARIKEDPKRLEKQKTYQHKYKQTWEQRPQQKERKKIWTDDGFAKTRKRRIVLQSPLPRCESYEESCSSHALCCSV